MTSDNTSFGDRIRELAIKFQEERRIQIHATSRILGAAAQLSCTHDQLIEEVAEILKEDLNVQDSTELLYSAHHLKQEFKSLREAKLHFQLKARSWKALAEKLNNQTKDCCPSLVIAPEKQRDSQEKLVQRVERIEKQLMSIRNDLDTLLYMYQMELDNNHGESSK